MRRRCSKCDINYPSDSNYVHCPVCDFATAQLSGVEDEDYDVKMEIMLLRDLSPEERKRILWRRKSLVRLGFLGAMLDLLVGSPVDLHELEDLIKKRGCSPDLAARIVL